VWNLGGNRKYKAEEPGLALTKKKRVRKETSHKHNPREELQGWGGGGVKDSHNGKGTVWAGDKNN